MEYSNNCSAYSPISTNSLWRTDGPEGGAGEIYYSSGNVGINTNNPSYPLTVNGTLMVDYIRSISSPTQTYMGYVNNASRIYVGGVQYANFDGASHVTDIGTSSTTDPTRITIGYNNLLYVDNQNQKVGILKSTPAYELDVNGSIAYSGSLLDLSDARLKTDIKPLSGSLEKLHALQGVTYTLKQDPDHKIEYGLLAQDVEKVFPELVEEKDDIKRLNYIGLIGPLVEAVKERDLKNQALEAENARLETQIEDLSQRLDRLEAAQ